MKISCTNTMVPGGTLTEKAQNLRRCGFDGISVFEEITDWTPKKEEELLTLEARTGVRVCEFCFSGADYGQLMNPDPAVAARSKGDLPARDRGVQPVGRGVRDGVPVCAAYAGAAAGPLSQNGARGAKSAFKRSTRSLPESWRAAPCCCSNRSTGMSRPISTA